MSFNARLLGALVAMLVALVLLNSASGVTEEPYAPDVAVAGSHDGGCTHAALSEGPWVPQGPVPVGPTGWMPQGPDHDPAPGPGELTCPGIRPGVRIQTPTGLCSLAFILSDGDRYFAATAGHCVGGPGDRITIGGVPSATVEASVDEGVGADFAVISIDGDQEHRVDPRMCFWNGPVGTQDTAPFGEVLLQSGHVVGFDGIVTRPRAGVAGGGGDSVFYWNSPTAPGDSGSAVQTASGGALGVHTHTSISFAGFKAGTMLGHGLRLVSMEHLELVTGDAPWVG